MCNAVECIHHIILNGFINETCLPTHPCTLNVLSLDMEKTWDVSRS